MSHWWMWGPSLHSDSGGGSIKILYLSKSTVRSSASKWKKGNILKALKVKVMYMCERKWWRAVIAYWELFPALAVCACEGGEGARADDCADLTGSINKKFSFNHQRLLVSSMKRVWALRERQKRETCIRLHCAVVKSLFPARCHAPLTELSFSSHCAALGLTVHAVGGRGGVHFIRTPAVTFSLFTHFLFSLWGFLMFHNAETFSSMGWLKTLVCVCVFTNCGHDTAGELTHAIRRGHRGSLSQLLSGLSALSCVVTTFLTVCNKLSLTSEIGGVPL